MSTPSEKYAQRLNRVVDVESVDNIFPAGPDIISLSQGKIYFYTTPVPKHRFFRSNIFYKAQFNTVDVDILNIGAVDSVKNDRDNVKQTVESMIRHIGIPHEKQNQFGVIVKDNSKSIVGKILKQANFDTNFRTSGINVNVRSADSWDADGFIDFTRELQNRFIEEYYKV